MSKTPLLRSALTLALAFTLILAACESDGGTGNGSSSSSSSGSSRNGTTFSRRSVSSSSRSSRSAQSASARSASSSSRFAYFRRGASSAPASSVVTIPSSSKASSLASSRGSSSSRALVSSSSSRTPASSWASSLSVSSMQALSSSSASSSLQVDTAASGSVRVHVQADRTEVMPGDEVTFTVSVRNLATTPIRDTQVVFSFLPQHLQVLESTGTNDPDHVVWIVDQLNPNEKRSFVLRAKLAQELLIGDTVRGSLIAIRNGTVEPSTLTVDLHVLDRLPTTGFADGTRPFGVASHFLSPVSSSPSGAALPAVVWSAMILLCVSLGARVGKKYF